MSVNVWEPPNTWSGVIPPPTEIEANQGVKYTDDGKLLVEITVE